MTHFNTLNVKLSKSKLKSGIENDTQVIQFFHYMSLRVLIIKLVFI